MKPIEAVADDIARWLREYAAGADARGYVVGISGGIDSATVAALCRRAVGDEVLGVLMPCHSADEDRAMAHLVVDAFDLRSITVDLSDAYDHLVATLPPDLGKMAYANIKPRLRMITLYSLAHGHHYLVAGTGNKSELMIGYFTKWGDGGVDLEPLGDLYKSQVRSLAHALGVPRPVIERPPTAGLWEGQTDEGEMGMTYEELDSVLAAIEQDHTAGVDPDLLQRVQHMIRTTAHKRAMPPTYHLTGEHHS
jgi:NAD+ synthase